MQAKIEEIIENMESIIEMMQHIIWDIIKKMQNPNPILFELKEESSTYSHIRFTHPKITKLKSFILLITYMNFDSTTLSLIYIKNVIIIRIWNTNI